MHTAARLLPEGTTELEARRQCGELVRGLIRQYGTCVHHLWVQHRMNLRACLQGTRDFTRETLQKLFDVLKVSPADAAPIWSAYVGEDGETIHERLQALLRRNGYAAVSDYSGFSPTRLNFLTGIGSKKGPPVFTLPVWKKLAPALGFSEPEKSMDFWRQEMAMIFEQRGRNVLGSMVEVILAEHQISYNRWKSSESRPPAFRDMQFRQIKRLFVKLRHGKPVARVDLQRFCDGLGLSQKRRSELCDAVIEAVIEQHPRLRSHPLLARMRLLIRRAYLAGEDLGRAVDRALAVVTAPASRQCSS